MNKSKRKFRYERKFVVKGIDLSELKYLIINHPAIFSTNYPRRRVNNIYLDSYGLSNYHENLSGNAQRIKIRIRWYGKLFGKIEKPILELKIKNGEVGKKHSFRLKPFTLNKKFSYKGLVNKVLKKSNLPKKILEMLKMSKISLLNSYIRDYFISSDKSFRITLDNKLQFFRIRERDNDFKENFIDKDKIILELKYPKEKDNEASKITSKFPFRLSANSKYVHGIRLLTS